MEQKLHNAASELPEPGLQFETIRAAAAAGETGAAGKTWRTAAALAVCVLLLISTGFGAYAYAAEIKEYNNAAQFFCDYGLPTEGLTRGEIKAVYRDITTRSFTYSKTAEVIENSLSESHVGGYEILQENPTPEDVENLWNYRIDNGQFLFFHHKGTDGIHYDYRTEYKEDSTLGFEVQDRSYLEKFDGEELIWSVSFTEFWIQGYSVVSDGVIAYGQTYTWSSTQASYAWMVKLDTDGAQVWKQMLDHGFRDEYIAAVLENADGSYAVISRGDLKYFCLSQCAADGTQTCFQRTEVGNYGIWNAARLGSGYIVQLGSYGTKEHARIVKVDSAGNLTETFSYSGRDAYYYITDMIEFDGNIYLSAYAVPKLADERQSAGGRYEIAAVLNSLYEQGIHEISSEELTPLVRDNYTAMLLICDPNAGTPQEFYSVKGSLGGKLSVSDSGLLSWDVESITTTFYSPATSAFTIGGTSYVFRYTFDASGGLVCQEKTGEIVDYRR